MAFDEQLHDAFDHLGDRLGAELRLAAERLTDALRLEHERQAAELAAATAAALATPPTPRSEPTPPTAPMEMPANPQPGADARLAAAVHAIGAARSLGECLDTLAMCAGAEASRAAVLIVRGGRFRGRRFVGFDSIVPEAIDVGDEDAGVLAAAARADAVVVGCAPAFAAVEHDGVALPITVGGQVVAVLYADQGTAASTAGAAAATARLDVLTSYAARCLEAQTAFKAARALAAGGDIRAARREERMPEHIADAGVAADGDAAALHYARLLVSEIKLYHEPAVVAGRRDRDLALRLGDEIARARVLYEQRVPPEVRDRTDYFDAEMVRTLADGDSTLIAEPS